MDGRCASPRHVGVLKIERSPDDQLGASVLWMAGRFLAEGSFSFCAEAFSRAFSGIWTLASPSDWPFGRVVFEGTRVSRGETGTRRRCPAAVLPGVVERRGVFAGQKRRFRSVEGELQKRNDKITGRRALPRGSKTDRDKDASVGRWMALEALG